MAQDSHIARRQVGVSKALGLHLRVAERSARSAHSFRSEVRVHCKGAMADGRSILSLLGLAAECGAMPATESEGCDAEDAVDALAGLISVLSPEPDDRGRESGRDGAEPYLSEAPACSGSPPGTPWI